MSVHQISIFLENRAGQLAEITRLLADNGVNLRALNIAETKDYGVLLGVSAGAINMARRALDVWESPNPYEGLGLTGITIKSHVNEGEEALLEKLRAISAAERLPICAMEDESAIFLTREGADWLGRIRYIEGSEVMPLTQEVLTRLHQA